MSTHNSKWARREFYSRRRVARRANWTCEYCGQDNLGLKEGTVDHIIPLSRGGSKRRKKNLAWSCNACNNSKGSEAKHPIGRTGVMKKGLLWKSS